MVKFGAQLEAAKREDWTSEYISYTRLKRVLERCKAARAGLQRLRRGPNSADYTSAEDSDDAMVAELLKDNCKPILSRIATKFEQNNMKREESSSRLALLDASAGARPENFTRNESRGSGEEGENDAGEPTILASWNDSSEATEEKPATEMTPLLSAPQPLPDFRSRPLGRSRNGLYHSNPTIGSLRETAGLAEKPHRLFSLLGIDLPAVTTQNTDAYNEKTFDKARIMLYTEVQNFWEVIEKDLDKVDSFYVGKLAEMQVTLNSFIDEGRGFPGNDEELLADDLESGTPWTPSGKETYRVRRLTVIGDSAPDLRSLKAIYIQLVELQDYVRLNATGFRKIVKKFDKVMKMSTLEPFMDTLRRRPFMNSQESMSLMEKVTSLISRDKLLELSMAAARVVHGQRDADSMDVVDMPPNESVGLVGAARKFWYIWRSGRIRRWFCNVSSRYRPWAITLSVFMACLAWFLPLFPQDPVAHRAFSILVLTVLLWVLKGIPYHATAMLIPPLAVFGRVIRDRSVGPSDDLIPEELPELLSADEVAKKVLGGYFNSTTFLILGGFTVSAAFARCDFEKQMAKALQQALGDHPRLFLLAIMFLGLFLSMWISNHTAPVLIISVLTPIISDLGDGDRYIQALLIGLSFSCNFGGMMTPIASMQNVIAAQEMAKAGVECSFGKWIAVVCPLCTVCVVVTWATICGYFGPFSVLSIPSIVLGDTAAKSTSAAAQFQKRAVLYLSLSTVALWATSGYTTHIFGNLGIISLMFMTIMFGSGMLTEVDLNSFSWHTLCLLGGSNVLGEICEGSGLLEHLVHGIMQTLSTNVYVSAVYVFSVACVVATLVSHTVASIILMPIIVKLGVEFGHGMEFAVGGVLCISAAMALPFCSFPNIYSLLVQDDYGKSYLGTLDFFAPGLPLSLVVVAMIGFWMFQVAPEI